LKNIEFCNCLFGKYTSLENPFSSEILIQPTSIMGALQRKKTCTRKTSLFNYESKELIIKKTGLFFVSESVVGVLSLTDLLGVTFSNAGREGVSSIALHFPDNIKEYVFSSRNIEFLGTLAKQISASFDVNLHQRDSANTGWATQ